MVGKQISVQKQEKATPKRKRISSMLVLVLMLSLLLTGCQVLSKTFGKTYVKIDDFFEQLNADLEFTMREYISTADHLTVDEKTEAEANIDSVIAEMNIAKEKMKLAVSGFKEMSKEMGVSMDVDVYVESALLETRKQLEDKISDISDGKIKLQHAEVKRGLLGSIWHFVRKHWLISLIILGILGNIGEAIENFARTKQKKKE